MNPDPIHQRLTAIETRLASIERGLADAQQLRAALLHESESRRQLAEQAAYLLEQLGEARRELQRRQSQGS